MVNVKGISLNFDKHSNSFSMTTTFPNILNRRCLMHSKKSKSFVFNYPKSNSSFLIKDTKIILEFLNFVEKITNTKIEFIEYNNKYIFSIVSLSESANYNVYRAMVLTRCLVKKSSFYWVLGILEFKKYLKSDMEILYLTSFMYPGGGYWNPYCSYFNVKNYLTTGYYQEDKSFNNESIYFYKDDFKLSHNTIYSFNDVFTDENINILISIELKKKLRDLVMNGNFKKAAKFYTKLKNNL